MTNEGRSRRPAPTALVVVSVVTGLVFAWPFLYIVWRNVTLGSDVWGELTSASTLEALGRTVALATTVALTAAALGTALPGSSSARTCRSGGSGACSRRCRSCSRRSWAPLR